MKFAHVIVTTLLSGTAFAGPSGHVVSSTAELRALSDDAFQRALPVEVSGKVLAVRYYGGVIVQDRTGCFFFEDIPEPRPKIGDLVSVSGKTYLYEGIRQGAVRNCRAIVHGHEKPTEPRLTSATSIASGGENFCLVKVHGIVIEAAADENNPNWNYLVLQADGSPFYTTIPNVGNPSLNLNDLVNAEVEIRGIGVPHYGAERMFIGPHLESWSRDCIRVLRPAPDDPFDAPPLGDIIHVSPHALTKLRQHRVEGETLAVWRNNKMLVAEDSGRILEVELAKGQRLPNVGIRVQAVGFPGTDLFRINLSRALCRTIDTTGKPPASATAVTVADITQDGHGRYQLNQPFHGKCIRLTGVVRNLPSPENADGRMNLDCDGYLVPVDLSANPGAEDGLSIGCTIAATGICVMETEKWSPSNLFPVFGGFMLVLRSPDDIRILSRPSWWTPARLLIVICSLFAALVATFVWNRILNRLVERRGRQLFKEQIAHAGAALKIGERTRLAVELHDALSQNLAGLACQISAAKTAIEIDGAQAANHLTTAERMLLSSRTELRRCLWDLRGDTLELENMSEAVTKTVKPVIGTAELTVRFNVPRSRLMDSTAHSILCIVRELAANAVRHGHAAHIRIAGEIHGDELSFSVRDDGTGFDVANCCGIAEGHFGLQGIRERVNHLEGTFDLLSSDAGTRAKVTLHVPRATPDPEENP